MFVFNQSTSPIISKIPTLSFAEIFYILNYFWVCLRSCFIIWFILYFYFKFLLRNWWLASEIYVDSLFTINFRFFILENIYVFKIAINLSGLYFKNHFLKILTFWKKPAISSLARLFPKNFYVSSKNPQLCFWTKQKKYVIAKLIDFKEVQEKV